MKESFGSHASEQAPQEEGRAPETVRIGEHEWKVGDPVLVRIVRDKEGRITGPSGEENGESGAREDGWTFAGRRENGTLRLLSPAGEKIAISEEWFQRWQRRDEVPIADTKAAPQFSRQELRQIEKDDREGRAGLAA